MRKITTVAVTLVLTLVLAACGSSGSGGSGGGGGSGDSGDSGAVRLGILIPQSGDAAVTGRFMTDGARAAIEQLNAGDGIAGHKIDYEVFDTVGDPQSGVNAFNKFSSDGYKFGVVGFSAVVTAIGPIAERQDMLLVNAGAPPFDADAMGSKTIHTLNGQDHEMQCAAQYAHDDLGARRVAAIFADIAANRAGVEAFSRDFEAAGGEVVGSESAPQGSTDFRSILTRLKQEDPDLVYIYTFGSDPGNILKQMRELGFDARTLSYSGAAVPQTIEVAGDAAEGSYYTAGLFDPTSRDPQTRAFVEAYRRVSPDTAPDDLTFYHATLYDGVLALADAMRSVQESGGDMNDPQQVYDAFFRVGRFPAATGTAEFTRGDPIARKPFQVLQVRDGRFTAIDTVEC